VRCCRIAFWLGFPHRRVISMRSRKICSAGLEDGTGIRTLTLFCSRPDSSPARCVRRFGMTLSTKDQAWDRTQLPRVAISRCIDPFDYARRMRSDFAQNDELDVFRGNLDVAMPRLYPMSYVVDPYLFDLAITSSTESSAPAALKRARNSGVRAKFTPCCFRISMR
jgi:hypothetical protein